MLTLALLIAGAYLFCFLLLIVVFGGSMFVSVKGVHYVDYLAIWGLLVYFFYSKIASIGANKLTGFALNLIIWIIAFALYSLLLKTIFLYVNPFFRILILVIAFFSVDFIIQLMIRLIIDFGGGITELSNLFWSKSKNPDFSNYFDKIMFGDYGFILFKSKLINQVLNFIFLIVTTWFVYRRRLRTYKEYTYIDMLIRGVPFKDLLRKENRIIYELYEEELERNDDSIEDRYKNFNNEKNTDSEYNKSDGEFKDTFNDDLIVEYREACNKLNVEYDDDIDTIKKQYKFLIKANHPDNHENNERAVKTLQSINVAYETIKKYRNFD